MCGTIQEMGVRMGPCMHTTPSTPGMRFCCAFCCNRSAHRAQLKRTMTEQERRDEVGVRGRGKVVPYEANAM